MTRLLSAERAAQPKLVADAELPMRLAALAVDLDLSALARLLRLRARAIQARDVEPDIEANAVGTCVMFQQSRPFAKRSIRSTWNATSSGRTRRAALHERHDGACARTSMSCCAKDSHPTSAGIDN